MTTQFQLDLLRFGFEYETLIDIPDAYKKLYKKTLEMIHSDEFKDVCNGMLQIRGYDMTDEELAEAQAQAEYDKELRTLLEAMDPTENIKRAEQVAHRFLLASIFNDYIKGASFAVASKTQQACSTFDISRLATTLTRTPKTPKTPKSKMIQETSDTTHKPWLVTPDMSVVQTDFLLYQSFRDILTQKNLDQPANILETIEMVSPVLTYKDVAEGWMGRVLDGMRCRKPLQLTYWNNEKTSTHVHMSYDHPFFHDNKPYFLIKLCTAWLYFEPIFMLLMGHWRRENRYAKGMRTVVTERSIFDTVHERNFKDLMGSQLSNEALVYAIIELFQGKPDAKESRYAAFNMLNMNPGGIQTVEVRIKQGSSDSVENQNFVLLLANFVKGVMERDGVAMTYSQSKKDAFWNLTSILMRHPEWSTSTSLVLPNADWEVVHSIFKEFLTYIQDINIKAHYISIFNKVCKSETKKRSLMNSPTQTPTQTETGVRELKHLRIQGGSGQNDKDIEITSFGVVNLKEMQEKIKRDPDFMEGHKAAKRLREQLKSKYRSSPDIPMQTKTKMPVTVTAYGGGSRKTKNGS